MEIDFWSSFALAVAVFQKDYLRGLLLALAMECLPDGQRNAIVKLSSDETLGSTSVILP